MKNHITTIINDVTPESEPYFWLVIDNLFNTFRERNNTTKSKDTIPSDLDDLNFQDWFSFN